MDRDTRYDKFSRLPKGTLLRINPKVVRDVHGYINNTINSMLKDGDCLHTFLEFRPARSYAIRAKSLATGNVEVFSVCELLMPGEEPD